MANSPKLVRFKTPSFFSFFLLFSGSNTVLILTVRINDTVTFVEDGFDEDIEFGDEISEDDEDDVDNVSKKLSERFGK